MTRRSLSLALLTVALFGLSTVPVVEGVEKRDGEFGQTGRQDRAATEHLVRHFTVTIDQGPSAGLAVFGLLTIEVELNRGTFTGTLTPAEDATTGQRLTSVMFRSEGGTRVPDPNVTQIQVRGSIDGHTLSMVMLDVGGPGKHIFGVGTTENDPGRRLRHDPGLVGGPAVGPQAGDRGDWLLTDGGGGGATPPPSTGTGAFYASNDTFFVITPFSGDVVVTQLTLPAGNYIVMGKVQAAAPPNFIIFPSFQVVCFLAIDITVGHGDVGVVAAASGVLGTLSLIGNLTLATTSQVQMICNGTGNIGAAPLTAIRVSGVTRQ